MRSHDRSPTAFVQTRLGRLPAEWRLSTVGAEFDIQTGFTLNAGRRPRHRKRRYLRVANVQRDALDLGDVQELEARDAEFTPRSLKVDDLLVVEGHADRMQIGRCARITPPAEGMTFQNHLFRLRTRGDVLPYFACLWLNSEYAQRYWNARCATSSGLNTINQRALRRMVVPVPSKTEQERIAEVSSSQRAQGERLMAKRQAYVDLQNALMCDLLAGRVSVGSTRREVVGAA
jgi:type I restriction enzyme S subunit